MQSEILSEGQVDLLHPRSVESGNVTVGRRFLSMLCDSHEALRANCEALAMRIAEIDHAANADAADLEQMRDGTKLTRRGVVEIIAYQQQDIAELKAEIEALRRRCEELTREHDLSSEMTALCYRAVTANHMRTHGGIKRCGFDDCRQGFCEDWHALQRKANAPEQG